MFDDSFYMRLALQEAWKHQLLTYPNPAVGAVVVDAGGRPIAVAAHKEAGKPHAEVLAIRDAYCRLTGCRDLMACDDAHELHIGLKRRAGRLFDGATIYVTLEPCGHCGKTPACSDLIAALGFRRVVVGSDDPNPEAAGGAERLECLGIEVVRSVEKGACDRLIEPFVKWRNGRFVLFKLAQTLNGVVDGGTISCEASRRWVHTLRTKVDTLFIGGNTVRCDRPRLDSRLVGGRAPDVAIFTRDPSSIDRTIPLFAVPEREVRFMRALPDRGLVMVEGGGAALSALENEIDWMVLFVAPFVKEGTCYNGVKNFDLLHQRSMGRDAMMWLKGNDG